MVGSQTLVQYVQENQEKSQGEAPENWSEQPNKRKHLCGC